MVIPLNILFWCMEAAYIMHCLDETIAGGGFVNMVKKRFWPEYSGKNFFGSTPIDKVYLVHYIAIRD